MYKERFYRFISLAFKAFLASVRGIRDHRLSSFGFQSVTPSYLRMHSGMLARSLTSSASSELPPTKRSLKKICGSERHPVRSKSCMRTLASYWSTETSSKARPRSRSFDLALKQCGQPMMEKIMIRPRNACSPMSEKANYPGIFTALMPTSHKNCSIHPLDLWIFISENAI